MIWEDLVNFCKLRFALEIVTIRYVVQRKKLKLKEKFQQILTEMDKNQGSNNLEHYLGLITALTIAFLHGLNAPLYSSLLNLYGG
jgi:hypothetical protein